MVVIDRRRSFILTTAHHFFGVPHDEDLDSNEVSLLDNFLDRAKCRTLYAAFLFSNSESRVSLTNELSVGNNTLVFFKISDSLVTETNFHDVVQMTSVSKNSATALAEELRQVWTPALRTAGVDSLFLKKLEIELLGPKAISSLVEEETFMREKARGARTPAESRLYEQAVFYLTSIRRDMESAAVTREGLTLVEETFDAVSGYLDELWRLKGPVYTELRMQSLLEIIGDEVAQLVQSLLSKVRIQSDGRVKDEAVALGAIVCEKWVAMSVRMTDLFWPHIIDHPWRGKPYRPEKCTNFGIRLKEIAEIRGQNRQLTKLLTQSERTHLEIDALFKIFDNVDELLGEENDVKWSRLKDKVQSSLAPIEERVATKLKTRITGAKTLLAVETEFRRYSDLVRREMIKNLLRAERQSLLSAYSDLIDAAQNECDTKELLDTPEILQAVQTAKVSELRLKSLQKLGQQLLDDLPGYEDISRRLTSCICDVEKHRQELVETWVTETQKSVARKELTLSQKSAVVELTGAKMMRVNFDPRLTTLIREGRGLAGQGVELPREIKDLVERASMLTRRARALQQVANFHNTIGDRMIPSQRPLMLAAALELAGAVREQSGVVWSDPRAVDAFTSKLQELVKRFAHQNAELASKHTTLRDLVSNLLKGESVNMVTNQKVWKDTLRSMRDIVSLVEDNYGNTKAWKLHWDRQLLKALGIAYRAALPSLIKKLSEIRVELTFRDKSLQWKPSLEDIRTKLYSGIRRFLAIPVNFRGVGDQADGHFQTLIPQSIYLFGGVYKEAEILLSALESFRIKWLSLVAPANVDVGQTLRGKQWQDWEKAFKDSKQWAQEVSKLRANEVKILCITVDTGTIRNDLESLSRRCWERLALDLRAEASSRLIAIVEFLSSALKKLSQRARTIEEIGEVYEAYSNIQKQYNDIAQELEDVSGLGRILAAWTREKLEGLDNAHIACESLKERMRNYQGVMVHQLEEAKLNLRHQVLAVHDEQERWNAKWMARPEVLGNDWIETMRERWTNLSEQRDMLVSDCKRLNLPVDEIFASDDKMVARMEAELEAEELNCKFQSEFMDELRRQEEEEWTVARRRLAKFHDWLDSWQGQIQLHSKNQREESLQEHDTSKHLAHSYIERRILELRESVEWVQLLKGEELADEHWSELKDILELEGVKHSNGITLGHLLQRSQLIQANAERIKDVTKRAAAESGIRQALGELEAWESYTSLPLQESKDSKNEGIYIVSDYSTLLARAGELKLILEGARGATGYERFASRAARCEAALHELEERVKLLNTIQRKWIYLEPVYGGGAAPSDSGRWARADKEFRYFIGEISRDPKIPSIKKLPFHALVGLKDLMDRCQRSLDDFLEEKRSAYPRLYFLSDDDLLELVSGKGKGLDVHLAKLYQGVGSIEKDNGYITSIVSPQGEKLRLIDKISLTETFPKWLLTLEESMRNALQQNLNTCLLEQIPNIASYPTQILLLCERIRFTQKCEIAIEDNVRGLTDLLKFLEKQRVRYKGLEDPGDELMSLKVKNLLLETVHHIHIVENLLNVISDKEKLWWNWNRQLRTYKNGGGAAVRCAKAEFPYCFEYQGAAVNLVRSPLTEKCYLALTQAMKLGLGGSPTGPAGTGKTESVKALGGILGRRVLVFNCDEGMDSGSMRRILIGLAQAGAWGCFDEFNRLEESTMSAVSMLIRPLQEAIRDGVGKINLDGSEIRVDPHCCLFITMNPAGDDYGGRRKLPDSLARLFRSIGMANPNKINIVTTLLECAGFMNSWKLANQLVETFDTAEKLLSKQAHYDWGLRALRSVLNAIPSAVGLDEVTENSRLLAGIHIATRPKLVGKDVPNFLSLLNDIFPAIDLPSKAIIKGNEDLQSILNDTCQSQNLNESLISRCIQLNDQLKNRSGVAIVGPPGCGKSLIIRTLADSLSKIGETVRQFQIYPGAISKSKLLGTVDPRTREFKEGLLSNVISNSDGKPLWIIFNGDVEPEWAEALNSALDDNRILTLSNGVAIKLGNETRFLFESHKLSNASPATVSRLGVVYLGEMSASILLNSATLSDLPSISTTNFIMNHLHSAIEQVLNIKKGQKSAPGLLRAAMVHFQNAHTQTSCIHALLLSICGQIESSTLQDKIARSIYQLTGIWCPDCDNPYDVIYNEEKDVLDPFITDAKTMRTDEGSSIYLSGSLQRGISATLPWITSGQAVLFRGPNGCGKNSLLSAIITLMKMESKEAISVIKTSSLYGSKDLIDRLKRSCVKLDSLSVGRTYKPKYGSNLILVIRDLHIASKNFQELIRQLIQEGGFYEDDLEFAKLPVVILSTSDSSTDLHPRLDSLFATHYLRPLKPNDIDTIVELHLEQSLGDDKIIVRPWIVKMSSIIVEAFNELSTNKDIIKWTLGDLMVWIDSLKYYPKPENESNMTNYLIDSSRRHFKAKLLIKQQKRLESIIFSRSSTGINFDAEVYVWKGSSAGLINLAKSHWKAEIENAVTRCIREGHTMLTSISPHLLEIAAGISWGLGCQRRGLLLTGRPGAGRRWATKIISVISSLRIIDSGPGRGKAFVKAAVQAAGIDGELTILIIEEYHLREDDMAILLCAIIANGELPGLYTAEELDGFVAPLADSAAREEFPGSLDQYLYHRLRRYLRVILIVDSYELKSKWLSETNIPRHCVQTTGQCLCSDWWLIEEHLTELASLYKDSSSDIKEEFSGSNEVVQAHLTAPEQQQVPARFLALLHKWKELRETCLRDILEKLKNLQAGIDRLKEAGDQIAKLEEDATKQRHELEVEKGRANATLEQITATMRGATGQRGEMTTLKDETERESAELARRKLDIEGELGKVEPLVEQAAQAVAGISAEALSEVRSLRAPPAPVRDVLEGVLRLMGIRDTSWNSMKTFLAKRGVKEEIRNWDARRSTPASLDAVAKLVSEKPESFEERTAKRASVAAAPLAAWVLANLQYGQIVQQVAPLEREQRLLADRLLAAETQICKLETGLNTVENKVAQLQEELAAHSRGAAELQLRTEATESSLSTARALLGKLDAEHNDWLMQFQLLTERKMRIGMEAADAAALLIYQPVRKEDERRKRAIDSLISERERLQWRAQGLPVDTDSLIGAARSLRSNLVPLFVDPSGVAVTWLRAHIGESRLEVARPGEPRFLTIVELAVRFGKPLLIEEIVELPSVLLPLLRRRPLRIGDRSLPAQQSFQLFLATRQEELLESLPSEADAVLMKIALGSGSRSLAERLVEKAILQETPEVEHRRRKALEREEQLSGEIEAARLELLVQLGAARGQNILQESQNQHGGGLLATLEVTQSKAREIERALDESHRDLEDVLKRSNEHERLAKFTAIIYKFIRSFATLSSLYVFTAEIITDIFLDVERGRAELTRSNKDEREKLLERSVITMTLHHCTKAVYRKHRLPLALHLAMLLTSVPEEQRNLLLHGESAYIGSSGIDIDIPNYIPSEQKLAVRALIGILPAMAENIKPSWMNNIASIYSDDRISQFEKILIIQALHPEYLHTALTKWTSQQLGVRNLTPPSWTLKQIAEENERRPVLLLLSPGADPAPELNNLVANKVLAASGFTEIALGQGHVAQAESALEVACKQGSWILLSNLQLALNWLPRLEVILRSPACTTHKDPNTRIWLTTEECNGFYSGLSGLCLKLAYEPPEGIKRNVKRSLQQLQQCQPMIKNPCKLLLISWLHAILQERRKFVPQGWTKDYGWSEADLQAACELVVRKSSKDGTKKFDEDWEADRGILDVAVYGGFLQDEYDMRTLKAILRHIWSKDMYRGHRKLGNVISIPKADSENPIIMIDRLDDADSLQAYFGLPANAYRAWERSAAELTLRYIREILRKTGKIGKDDADKALSTSVFQCIKDMKTMIDQQRIIEPTNVKEATHELEDDPLKRFFTYEINTTKELLEFVRSNLDILELKADLKTPAQWIAHWRSGPRDSIPFVNQLILRYQSLKSLNGLPNKVKLTWFSMPGAFLSALKLYSARETKRPFENLQLQTKWTKDFSREGIWKTSVILEGLLLTGARIQNGILEEVTANASSVVTAPDCLIAFIDEKHLRERDEESRGSEWSETDAVLTADLNTLQVPVYADSFRNHLVCSLPVPYINDQRDIWHQRGISFHLRTN
ncbi:PREDICTED: cytoplasmic dynein 2 heavy chain 1 [Ceratosolen solmsi marchali]|uniref:Dynein heavy chain, cytoplasmic n=1 Tax=Ceratosolen solmsi marchali TaxID=326594 RepID=A0AAJ6YPU3_9HYME|nr:PREDICTED: cytoplasmic dynein 2 heavy chain 1 [Ceratosolen solmsi marchali]